MTPRTGLDVQVPSSSTEAAQQAVQQYASAAQSEYGSLEKALSIGLSPGPEATHVLTQQGQQQLLTLLLLLPHGVVKHSHTVPGTSASNLPRAMSAALLTMLLARRLVWGHTGCCVWNVEAETGSAWVHWHAAASEQHSCRHGA